MSPEVSLVALAITWGLSMALVAAGAEALLENTSLLEPTQ